MQLCESLAYDQEDQLEPNIGNLELAQCVVGESGKRTWFQVLNTLRVAGLWRAALLRDRTRVKDMMVRNNR